MHNYIKHLTVQDYAFNGFRVTLTRQKKRFTRYFSELAYGGVEGARREAERVRDAILEGLEQHPGDPEIVFASFRKRPPEYPPGLNPQIRPIGAHPATCTIRCGGQVAALQKHLCEQLQLDRSSSIKLALYALMVLLNQPEYDTRDLFQLVRHMERQRPKGAPAWDEYAAAKPKGNRAGNVTDL